MRPPCCKAQEFRSTGSVSLVSLQIGLMSLLQRARESRILPDGTFAQGLARHHSALGVNAGIGGFLWLASPP